MAHNIAKKPWSARPRRFGKVFPDLGKVAGNAARAVFSAGVRTGSALVTDLAAAMDGDATSRKGRQERVSGWLARYDFASPVRGHLRSEGVALVGRDAVIAVDSGDVSKEFGGAGMEGMEMGYGASRGVVAMGHSLLCAAAVARRRAVPLRLALLKGRRGLPDAETDLFDAIVGAVGRDGIGTGRSIDDDRRTPRASAPRCDPRPGASRPRCAGAPASSRPGTRICPSSWCPARSSGRRCTSMR